MANRFFLGAVGILLIGGCPTQTIYYDAGTEAPGGQTRDSGAGLSGGAIGSSGSGGGVAGESGLTGVAGTSSGDRGVAGNGGASGGASGYSGGPGGASGGMGAAGTGGHGAYESGSVICGAVSNCPIANGGRCCYGQMDQSSVCQVAAANCGPLMSGTIYYVKTLIQCDSASDCATGQICCYTEVYLEHSTACVTPSACVDAPPPSPGGYATYRRQVCDPSVIAPTECLSGSCKVATTYNQVLPPYLYLCL